MNFPATTLAALRIMRGDALPATEIPRLDAWRLTALVSAGPHSRVYRARAVAARQSDEVYALKVLAGEGQSREAARRMLLREAVIGRSISHPHVISVLACQTQREPAYLVMPYLPGATLREVLRARRRVPLAHALWIARQIAQALAALHEHGWRHADVKPENIHIAPDGHATLLDLGLAQRLDAPVIDMDLALAGTLRYLAPECFVSSGGASAASDLYSLGVVLYELLSGHPPFTQPDAADLATAHLEEPPAPLKKFRTARGALPPGVCRLVHQLLSKNPLRRPESAAAVVAALCRYELAAVGEEVAEG